MGNCTSPPPLPPAPPPPPAGSSPPPSLWPPPPSTPAGTAASPWPRTPSEPGHGAQSAATTGPSPLTSPENEKQEQTLFKRFAAGFDNVLICIFGFFLLFQGSSFCHFTLVIFFKFGDFRTLLLTARVSEQGRKLRLFPPFFLFPLRIRKKCLLKLMTPHISPLL